MKRYLIVNALLIVISSSYSQSNIITLFNNNKTNKVIKWYENTQQEKIFVAGYYLEQFIYNDEFTIGCVPDSMSVLEMSILSENETLTNYFLDETSITNNTAILSKAINSAISVNDFELIKRLEKLGGTIGDQCDFCNKRNSLQIALGNKASREIINYILSKAKDEDFKNYDCLDMSVLQFFVSYGDLDLLKQYYRKLSDQISHLDLMNGSAFSLAIYNENIELARFILDKLEPFKISDSLRYETIIYGSDFYNSFNIDYGVQEFENEQLSAFYDSIYYDIFADKNKKIYLDKLIEALAFHEVGYYDEFNIPEIFTNGTDFINENFDLKLKFDKKIKKGTYSMDLPTTNFYMNLFSSPNLEDVIEKRVSKEQLEYYQEEIRDMALEYYSLVPSFNRNTLIIDSEINKNNNNMWYVNTIENYYVFLNKIKFYAPENLGFWLLEKNFKKIKTVVLNFENSEFEDENITLPNYIFDHPVVEVLNVKSLTFENDFNPTNLVTVKLTNGTKVINKPMNVSVVYQ